ncbi:hypothetical protein [Companilactobacillus halodurans]|uniref:Zinc-binding dehydrogenase n=1 Tax=Companilactobacillus halodurans TaxID=2584183 RepID=A0A5P0ZRE8_9LACO|nr:hypothetical protein [Companilactobacillus halodurans]MQS76788.1 hypothetical protein [Companilactobacillus halodurans]MQS98515.1 hypothetical protein [Companilactobacillus halodurans]
MIPSGVFLTSYAGEATDLSAEVLSKVLKQIEQKEIEVPIAHVYQGLENVGQAQQNLESNKYNGKYVVVL